jgi:RecB family endonuclease NucS
MSNAIPIADTHSIRDCGFDEFWLQDQIVNNPRCLQMGELEFVSREHQQTGGGRLDILLKDEDDCMYEVK